MLPRHNVGAYQENEFTRNLSSNTRPRSSKLAEPLFRPSTSDPPAGLHFKNKQTKLRQGMVHLRSFPRMLVYEEWPQPPPPPRGTTLVSQWTRFSRVPLRFVLPFSSTLSFIVTALNRLPHRQVRFTPDTANSLSSRLF